ncbi:MAG: octaprenyl diphosphate synthase [Gammaproteobacteria bacterium]|nr:octaprenyl diphosphate synthase [Gammaproteobacteria bacterium]MDH5777341.1 octaprenyl diphosphate synthase [Gammaproteobacteria bacterium]
MELEEIYSLINADMEAVNQCITSRLSSDVILINQIGHHIVNSGGKRLRPVLHLLATRALGYKGSHHIELAALIEFIHTATLLHDDVVDASELRRGQDTANSLWGNEASVLVGDFLYSRAFQMMVQVRNMRVMEILADATNTIAEGEVQQLLNVHDPDTTEENYFQVIHNKTAKLFESATQLAAVVCEKEKSIEQAMANYGIHLGTAFQLVDDCLDYSSSADEIGKNIGDDLAEGKPTLPLIYSMRVGTPEQVNAIRQAIETGGRKNIDEVMVTINATGAIEYTAKAAREEADKAIQCLANIPDSDYKTAMQSLAEFSVNRTY